MYKILKKLITFLLIITLVCSSAIFVVFAGDGDSSESTKALVPDNDKKGHNALYWDSYGTPSQKAKQAFVVGWNIRFKSLTDPSKEIYVYIPRYIKDWSASPQKYRYPLTVDWDFGTYPTLNMSEIPNDYIDRYITDKNLFKQIIYSEKGFHAYANACVQKFTYNPNRTPKYQPISGDDNIANTKDELLDKFKEYGDTFLKTTSFQCYEINFDLPKEAKLQPLPPTVKITQPEDNSNVYIDEDTQIFGAGHNCHHLTMSIQKEGTINELDLGTVTNTQEIAKDMAGTWHYKFSSSGTYQLILRGMNTPTEQDKGYEIATDTHKVYVSVPEGKVSDIYVRYLKSGTNEEFQDKASRFLCSVNHTKKVSVIPSIGSYSYYGSAVTDSPTIPPETTNKPNPISVTIPSTGTPKYVYIWMKDTPPPQTPHQPTAVIDNDLYKIAGQDVNMKSNNSIAYDNKKVVKSEWTVPNTIEPRYSDEEGIEDMRCVAWYPAQGTYDIKLKVTDSGGLVSNEATGSVLIDPPAPFANISASGIMKENRKVTLDASESTTSSTRFPLDWSATEWTITPDLASGATWDFGIRLEEGRVFRNDKGQAYETLDSVTSDATGHPISYYTKGQKKFYFQARNKGQYIITLKIKASLDAKYIYSGTRDYFTTISKTLYITEDSPPTADFTMPVTALRDIPNPNDPESGIKYGRVKISCTSTSEDGDTFGKRVWQYKYDANNNGSLAEDSTTSAINVENLNSATCLIAKNTNDSEPILQSYLVGTYYFRLIVTEAIPDDTTIKELLLPSDYKTSTKSEW